MTSQRIVVATFTLVLLGLIAWSLGGPLVAQQPAPPRDADRAEAIQRARDEVELLAAELEVRKAYLAEAEVRYRYSVLRVTDLQRAGSSVSAAELVHARAETELSKAGVDIKQAELKVAEVQLKQAQKRLTRLERPLF
jgi:hypothetical protein